MTIRAITSMRTIKSKVVTVPETKPVRVRGKRTPLTLEWEKVTHRVWNATLGDRAFRIKRGLNGADGVVVTERDKYNKEIRYATSPNVNEAQKLVETWI